MAAAAKRPPLPPMLPNRKVRSRLLRSDRRDRPLAALQAMRVDGAGRDVEPYHRERRRAGRGGRARLAVAADGMQERLHTGDVARAAAVAVALEHGVRVVGEQVVEEVLDERVRAAAVGAEQQREDVAGRGGAERGAQCLAGAGPVDAAQPGRRLVEREAVERQRRRRRCRRRGRGCPS